jgi:hypothetical protein
VKRKRIIVAPETEFQSRRRLFDVLSRLYPVDFEAWHPGESRAFDAAICWEGCPGENEVIALSNGESLMVARSEGPLVTVQKGGAKFGASSSLDHCFRSQGMVDECIESFSALKLRDGDEVLCSLEGQPCWIGRRGQRGTTWITALAPEEFGETQTVYDHFNRRRWLRLLPFFQYLKRLTQTENWDTPPVRACLMFDDPNLHWPTYGFIDLRKLAVHAQENNYHVSCAMVPFDGWFVNARARALFKEQAARLSLCMHGNDHTHTELGATLDSEGFTRMLAQALRRIDQFEKKSGVPVSRVMVPPYGAFRESVANPMLNLGYEAVCVSRASLTSWNKGRAWAATFGHSVAEFIGTGFPVIPRQVMAPGHEGTYRLAAFLGQPIIPHGHHQDCANGFDLLTNVANSINSLGQVAWMDMASLSRSNFLTRRSGDTLVVKMLARHIALPLVEGVKEIVVERPWIGADGSEPLRCTAGEQTIFSGKHGAASPAISISGKRTVSLLSPAPSGLNYQDVPAPRFQAWSTARRFLSEARDRISPLGSRIGRKPAASANGSTPNMTNPTLQISK